MMAGQATPMIDNPPLPFLEGLTTTGKGNLQCNFSFSIKVAEAIFTIHFKTAGIKELFGYNWWKYITYIFIMSGFLKKV